MAPCLPSGDNYLFYRYTVSGITIDSTLITIDSTLITIDSDTVSGDNLLGSTYGKTIFSLWPDQGVKSWSGSNGTISRKSSILANKSDYYQLNVGDLNNYYCGVVGTGGGFWGQDSGYVYSLDGYVYIPSSNAIFKQALVGWSTGYFPSGSQVQYPLQTINQTDQWVRLNQVRQDHGPSDTGRWAALCLEMQSTTGAFASGNNLDVIYFKDIRVVYPNVKPDIYGDVINLTQQINRLQSYSIQENVGYDNIRSLGALGYDSRKSYNNPSVVLDFSYLMVDFVNEERFGFNINQYDYIDNATRYPTTGYNTFEFLTGKNLNGVAAGYDFPFKSSILKNFYVVLPEKNQEYSRYNLAVSGQRNEVYVYELGNAYLTNYRQTASVGQFPIAQASFLCENFNVNDSIYGKVPTVSYSGKIIPGNATAHYCLPEYETKTGIAAIKPGDIQLTISNSNDLYSVFETDTVSSYGLEIAFPRYVLDGVNYKFPVSRPLINPIIANISINGVIREDKAQDLQSIFNNNASDIKISLYGCKNGRKEVMQMRFLDAKLDSYNISNQVGGFRQYQATFSQEIGDWQNGASLFMSGILYNNPVPMSVNAVKSGYDVSIDFVKFTNTLKYFKGQ